MGIWGRVNHDQFKFEQNRQTIASIIEESEQPIGEDDYISNGKNHADSFPVDPQKRPSFRGETLSPHPQNGVITFDEKCDDTASAQPNQAENTLTNRAETFYRKLLIFMFRKGMIRTSKDTVSNSEILPIMPSSPKPKSPKYQSSPRRHFSQKSKDKIQVIQSPHTEKSRSIRFGGNYIK